MDGMPIQINGSKQELFDQMIVGLTKQGFNRSFCEEREVCRYYGPNGHKCPIGHLIPENLFVSDIFEEYSIQALYNQYLILCDQETLNFLSEAQAIHDNSLYPYKMIQSFYEFAKKHELRINSN